MRGIRAVVVAAVALAGAVSLSLSLSPTAVADGGDSAPVSGVVFNNGDGNVTVFGNGNNTAGRDNLTGTGHVAGTGHTLASLTSPQSCASGAYARITVINRTAQPLALADSVLDGQNIPQHLPGLLAAGASATGVACSPLLGPSYTVVFNQGANSAGLTLSNIFGGAVVGGVTENGLALSYPAPDAGPSGVGMTITVTG
ncbi:hypothetical protein [Streptomyces sp. NPDC002516]